LSATKRLKQYDGGRDRLQRRTGTSLALYKEGARQALSIAVLEARGLAAGRSIDDSEGEDNRGGQAKRVRAGCDSSCCCWRWATWLVRCLASPHPLRTLCLHIQYGVEFRRQRSDVFYYALNAHVHMPNFSFFAHLHGFRSTFRDAVLGRPFEFNRPAYQLQSSGTVLKVYTCGASIEPAATHSETKPIRYIHATSGGLTHVQE
jgi:hypothetical protein